MSDSIPTKRFDLAHITPKGSSGLANGGPRGYDLAFRGRVPGVCIDRARKPGAARIIAKCIWKGNGSGKVFAW